MHVCPDAPAYHIALLHPRFLQWQAYLLGGGSLAPGGVLVEERGRAEALPWRAALLPTHALLKNGVILDAVRHGWSGAGGGKLVRGQRLLDLHWGGDSSRSATWVLELSPSLSLLP